MSLKLIKYGVIILFSIFSNFAFSQQKILNNLTLVEKYTLLNKKQQKQ